MIKGFVGKLGLPLALLSGEVVLEPLSVNSGGGGFHISVSHMSSV